MLHTIRAFAVFAVEASSLSVFKRGNLSSALATRIACTLCEANRNVSAACVHRVQFERWLQGWRTSALLGAPPLQQADLCKKKTSILSLET